MAGCFFASLRGSTFSFFLSGVMLWMIENSTIQLGIEASSGYPEGLLVGSWKDAVPVESTGGPDMVLWVSWGCPGRSFGLPGVILARSYGSTWLHLGYNWDVLAGS